MGIRDICGCMQLGQAAGAAAALAVRQNTTVRELEPRVLRDELPRQGVCLARRAQL